MKDDEAMIETREYRITYSEWRFIKQAFYILLLSNVALASMITIFFIISFFVLDANNFLSRGVNALEAIAGG